METYIITSHFKDLNIEVKEETTRHIVLPRQSHGTLILRVLGEGNLKLTLTFEEGSSWTYLWINQSNAALTVHERVILKRNAHVKANYAELSLGNHTKETVIHFEGRNTHLELRGASMAFNRLRWDLVAQHSAKQSFAQLNNYAIVLDDAMFNMEVTGRILNGNSGSKTHQITRIMNLGDAANATVFPKLLIEENDVEASHAATVGQPDEEHVHYLQSRGISRREALKLLVKGYLIPIANDIENETIKKELIEEIEVKVNALWQEI